MDWHSHLATWLRSTGPSPSEVPRTSQAWSALAVAACQRGLAGLLLEASPRFSRDLPDHVTDTLRQHASVIAAENLNAVHVLEGILRAFNRAAVPVMLLKGAALNLTLYPRLDLRPMSDVDLLIRPETAGRVLQLLEEGGCRRGVNLLRDDFFPMYHYEVDFTTNTPVPVAIDLHARPLRPLRIARTMPDDALWEGARTVRVGDALAQVPRPELMFVHLAAHAAYHGCSRLLWLYDLKRLVDDCRSEMEWSLVTRRANDWRLSLPVLRAIEQASALIEPFFPPQVLGQLRGHRTGWRDRLALAQAPRDAASPAAHVAVNLLCTPGVRFRLGYLLAMMLPGRKHLGELYPLRHPGWPVCAHTWRVLRAAGRLAACVVRGFAHAVAAMVSRARGWPTSSDVGARFLAPNREPTFERMTHPS